jgi:hypothetical protein
MPIGAQKEGRKAPASFASVPSGSASVWEGGDSVSHPAHPSTRSLRASTRRREQGTWGSQSATEGRARGGQGTQGARRQRGWGLGVTGVCRQQGRARTDYRTCRRRTVVSHIISWFDLLLGPLLGNELARFLLGEDWHREDWRRPPQRTSHVQVLGSWVSQLLVTARIPVARQNARVFILYHTYVEEGTQSYAHAHFK